MYLLTIYCNFFIQALKTEIERSYATSPSLVENLIRQSSVIDISVLLKQLVRHLPEPLLTNSHMDAFLLVPSISSYYYYSTKVHFTF